jgi:hypothetical protein
MTIANHIEFLCCIKKGSEIMLRGIHICFAPGKNEVPFSIEAELLTMKAHEVREIRFDCCNCDNIASYFQLPAVKETDSTSYCVRLQHTGQWTVPSSKDDLGAFLAQCELSPSEILTESPSGDTWDITHAGRIFAEHSMIDFASALVDGDSGATGECTLAKNRSVSLIKYSTDHLDKNYVIPLWRPTQLRETFLPDLYKVAAATNCRLIILLEGEHTWPCHPAATADSDLTVNDVGLNVTVESECSDPSRSCVLTWCRYFDAPQAVMAGDEVTGASLRWGTEFEDGFRCALLRVEGWQSGAAPSPKLWRVIDALLERCQLPPTHPPCLHN